MCVAVIYIKMEDATYSFVRPHLIDVKIGAEAWEPTASKEKIHRQRVRCPYLSEIGFQVLGAKVRDSLDTLRHKLCLCVVAYSNDVQLTTPLH